MKLHDEVLEKFGELVLDLGKAAVITGFAVLFFEKFQFLTTVGSIFLGLLLITWVLDSFHVLGRRHKGIGTSDQPKLKKEQDHG